MTATNGDRLVLSTFNARTVVDLTRNRSSSVCSQAILGRGRFTSRSFSSMSGRSLSHGSPKGTLLALKRWRGPTGLCATKRASGTHAWRPSLSDWKRLLHRTFEGLRKLGKRSSPILN